jgi:iron transport multicopper oxidase
MQESIQFPDVMIRQCQKQNIPIIGNAANHSDLNGGWLDLAGQPAPPPPLPNGFTAKGYGAMAGCALAAVIGMATIIWYGITEPEKHQRSNGDPVINPAFLIEQTQPVGED